MDCVESEIPQNVKDMWFGEFKRKDVIIFMNYALLSWIADDCWSESVRDSKGQLYYVLQNVLLCYFCQTNQSIAKVYQFNVPTFGPGVVFDVDYTIRQEQFKFFTEALRVTKLRGYVDQMVMEAEVYACKCIVLSNAMILISSCRIQIVWSWWITVMVNLRRELNLQRWYSYVTSTSAVGIKYKDGILLAANIREKLLEMACTMIGAVGKS